MKNQIKNNNTKIKKVIISKNQGKIYINNINYKY